MKKRTDINERLNKSLGDILKILNRDKIKPDEAAIIAEYYIVNLFESAMDGKDLRAAVSNLHVLNTGILSILEQRGWKAPRLEGTIENILN